MRWILRNFREDGEGHESWIEGRAHAARGGARGFLPHPLVCREPALGPRPSLGKFVYFSNVFERWISNDVAPKTGHPENQEAHIKCRAAEDYLSCSRP